MCFLPVNDEWVSVVSRTEVQFHTGCKQAGKFAHNPLMLLASSVNSSIHNTRFHLPAYICVCASSVDWA